jgi:ribosome biogenesis protein SSF1/2
MGRKKSKKTHVKPTTDTSIPKSFVIKSGEISYSLTQLVRDVRRMMEPNTATNLKERKGNKIKDFLMVAGQLGVSHLLIVSSTTNSITLRMTKIPKGPTLCFQVLNYSLIKDILKSQKNPRSPGLEFLSAPLVVLNNFKKTEKHSTLMATMLQNMFPSIKVSSMKLSQAKRVVLFHMNEDGIIELRHYLITVKSLGVSKSIKSILQTKVPDLTKYDDISDFIIKGAFASESDVEDAVSVTESVGADKRAVKLVELGPRMNLKLIKIEDGFCGGQVLYHSFVKKSEEQLKELTERKEREAREKSERRLKQEENVRLKKAKNAAANPDVDAEGDAEGDAIDEEEPEYNEEDFDDLMEQDFEDADEGEVQDSDME